MPERIDIAIIGAGAAGLMAAIWAGRTARAAGRELRIVALDGAKKIGVKILVAGGGRCNVTHHAVDESAYAGSSRHAIKKVLRSFDVARTVEFFAELGVQLKREETGKLFPITDDAHTVLDALIGAARMAGAELRHPWRVESLTRTDDGFSITPAPPDGGPPAQPIVAGRVIICTGGMAMPKSGSDGHGYTIVRGLGHSTTGRILPALVPMLLAEGHFLRALSGITFPATLELRSGTGKKLASFTNSTLATHFGLSGPGPLDISRYFFDALAADPGTTLRLCVLPGQTVDSLDSVLRDLRNTTIGRFLGARPHGLAERLANALCNVAGVSPADRPEHLTRERRRALAAACTELVLPVTGSRGFTYAEVTAGGVPLAELHLDTMASRSCEGLFLAGEICDVDGRIGGFNFQWAWASGYLAGVAAAK